MIIVQLFIEKARELLSYEAIFNYLIKGGLILLKFGVYLYLVTGVALALFTGHWQSKVSLLTPETQTYAIAKNTLSSSNYLNNKMIFLSKAYDFYVREDVNRQWLEIHDNNKVYIQFSGRETAAVLMLDYIYNLSMFVIFIGLITLLIMVNSPTFKVKISLLLSGVLFSQLLLPWSMIYQYLMTDLFASKPGLLADSLFSNNILFFISIIIVIFYHLPLLISQISQRIVDGKAAGKSGNNIKSLIAYASQSGTAAAIAKNIVKQLPKKSGYHLACVSSLKAHQLHDYQHVFLLASTYGDGEPPEQAIGFMTSLQKLEPSLSAVKYSVLALGDTKYPKFCAFGHQLSDILQQKGAQALMPVTEINQGHEGSIQLWWRQLTQLLGWQNAKLEKTWYQQQVLVNECLNENVLTPEVNNRPAHHLSLSAKTCDFSPGDLVEIQPKNNEITLLTKLEHYGWSSATMVILHNKKLSLLSALHQLDWQDEHADNPQALVEKLPELNARTYSIASYSEQGVIDLLVRKLIKDDGSVGLCSGYLAELKVQDTLTLAIKKHSHFHPPSVTSPIIMIAAGTGLAPFIGFLEQRMATTQRGKAWLIMGERNKQYDNYFDEKLTRFQHSDCLHKRQHAWSQSSEYSDHQARYVGDILQAEQENLCHWLFEKNAKLYICGNASTLGVSCDRVLTDMLGEERLEKLKRQQQIRYDLY